MISGIHKLSLVDYPGFPSFVIFLSGCNMRCPFCHNKSIVKGNELIYDSNEVLEMIKSRKNFLDAIVITGGEPTIYGEKLIDLIENLRKINLKIKLDTNGINPDILKIIIDRKLVDYIAMDIKNTFEKYNLTCGINVNIDNIKKSIELIENSGIDYEFRTTINKDMHNLADIQKIANNLNDKKHYFLQPYRYTENQLVDKSYGEFLEKELNSIYEQTNVTIKV